MPILASQYRSATGMTEYQLNQEIDANIEEAVGDVSTLNVAGSTDLVDAVNDMNDFPSLVLLFENQLI